MTIRELLIQYGNSNENWLILEFLLDTKYTLLKLDLDRNIDSVYDEFKRIKKKREENYPLQYIFGKWEFYGLEFFVNESALIPRFETEILVDEILKLDCKKDKILDIGSGSGVISISLAYHLKNSKVIGVDISDKAIALANKNKLKLGVENVDFIQSDIFSNVDDRNFDLIVSNPPYIDSVEIETLEKELYFEPKNALYGGEDGLYFYREIIRNSSSFLKENGVLAFEIGHNQRDSICKMLDNNNFKVILSQKDFSGFDRIIIARKG